MARILLFLMVLAALVVIILGAVSLFERAAAGAQAALRPTRNDKRGALMAPTTFQKIAYAGLLVVLLGVTSGLIGGL